MSGVFVKDNQGDEDETCLEYLSRTTKVLRLNVSGVFVKDNQGDEDETCLEYLSRTTKVMRVKRVWSICQGQLR